MLGCKYLGVGRWGFTYRVSVGVNDGDSFEAQCMSIGMQNTWIGLELGQC